MKTKVSDQGVLLPKKFLVGVEEVEIRREDHGVVVTPITQDDPILLLGTQPIENDIADGSSNHDRYIYKQ